MNLRMRSHWEKGTWQTSSVTLRYHGNPTGVFLSGGSCGDGEIHTGSVAVEAEDGDMQRQGQGLQGWPATQSSRQEARRELWEGPGSGDTMVPDSQPLALRNDTFLLLEPTRGMAVSAASLENQHTY